MNTYELEQRIQAVAQRQKDLESLKIEELSLDQQEKELITSVLNINAVEIKKLLEYLNELLEKHQRTNITLSKRLNADSDKLDIITDDLKRVTDDLSTETLKDTLNSVKTLNEALDGFKTYHETEMQLIREIYERENEEITRLNQKQRKLFEEEMKKYRNTFTKNHVLNTSRKFLNYALFIFFATIIASFMGHSVFSLLRIFFNWIINLFG